MTAPEVTDPAEIAEPEDVAALQRYGSGLLRWSVDFALETLDVLSPFTLNDLLRPTPCEGWDLWMLLRHLDDSLTALNEAVTTGSVRLEAGADDDVPGVLVASLRTRARLLLSAWTDADHDGRIVLVEGCPVRAGVVAGTGAVELVVHTWDIARTVRARVKIPVELAVRLLRLVPLLVRGHARSGLFGPPVAVPDDAAPGDRLVAFLGRDPHWSHDGPSGRDD